MRSPTMLRRLGTSAVLGAVLIGAGVATLVPFALANHTAPNGAVTNGFDLVFVDCVPANRTTTGPATVHPAASPTDSAGRNPQAAATGSGCTVQAPTGFTRDPNTGARTGPAGGTAYTLKVRFTINAQPFPGRTIAFTTTKGTLAPTACVTDGAGECTTTIRHDVAETVTVTARETGTGESATENVEFRDNSALVATADETHRVVVQPAEDDYTGTNCEGGSNQSPTQPNYVGTGGTGSCVPNGSTATTGNGTIAPSGTPGRPLQVTYQLFDSGVPAGELPVLNPAVVPKALTFRTVNLVLGSDKWFFTPNCGPIAFPSTTSTTPARGDYRQCSFRNGPNDGSVAGQLTNLGTEHAVTSDENGLVTVTVATDTNSFLDDDGLASVSVLLRGVAGYGPPGQPQIATTENGTPAPLNFNTRNRPLNGVQISIVSTDTPTVGFAPVSSPLDAGPQPAPAPSAPVTGFRRTFRPLSVSTPAMDRTAPSTMRFVVLLRDQFLNLVRVPETDVAVSATGPGVLLERECRTASSTGGSLCTNPAATNTNFGAASQPQTSPPSNLASNPPTGSTRSDRTTGSYDPAQNTNTGYRNIDPFRATSFANGPVTLSATWQAPLTTFAGGGTGGSATPTAAATATATSTATAIATATATPTVTPTATPTTAAPTASATPTQTTGPTPTPTFTQQPTRFAARVSLVSSHSRVTAGNGPRLTGQVFDQNGQPLGGVNVTVLQTVYGQNNQYSATRNGSLTSGFDGRFSLVVNPTALTKYGANTDSGVRSNLVTIRVNARMDITSPAPNALVRNPVTLTGRILPAYNNRPIGLAWIDPAGRYRFLGQAPTTNGAFSVRSGGIVPSGTWTFVVYMSPTQGTEYGSRSLRLTVR
ncbi:MAG TPA: Ig-like domain-containing protein [Mycobacteriales bacterium]|nr:Ig-like domain-containing protein [Mycobacteriales bacterium]